MIDFKFTVIIPARYASARLPGKPLLDIGGKPLIQHVYEAACRCQAHQIYIATDDMRIKERAEEFGAQVILTSSGHTSGTDRLAEAACILGLKNDQIIINLQGDELGMPAGLIHQVASAIYRQREFNIATLYEPIEKSVDVNDPNIVKVVFDQHNKALYFSRAAIPYITRQHTSLHYRHIGLYAYRVAYLKKFTITPMAILERYESLEQLRALVCGENIYIEKACESAAIGIDTEADLLAAHQWVTKFPAI